MSVCEFAFVESRHHDLLHLGAVPGPRGPGPGIGARDLGPVSGTRARGTILLDRNSIVSSLETQTLCALRGVLEHPRHHQSAEDHTSHTIANYVQASLQALNCNHNAHPKAIQAKLRQSWSSSIRVCASIPSARNRHQHHLLHRRITRQFQHEILPCARHLRVVFEHAQSTSCLAYVGGVHVVF